MFEFCERQYIRTSVNVKKFNLKVPTKVNTKAGLGDKKSIFAALLRLENRSPWSPVLAWAVVMQIGTIEDTLVQENLFHSYYKLRQIR